MLMHDSRAGDHPANMGTGITAVDTVVQLPTDKVLADQYRAEIEPMLKRICEIMNEADFKGIAVGFGVVRNQHGRFASQLEISKRL